MAGTTYAVLAKKQAELIRKAKYGSVFVGDTSVTVLTTLTDAADKLLKALPTGMEDLGWTTNDGAQFSRDVAASTVTSWGSVQPTRTDINSDSTTMTVMAQETKAATIAMATGVNLAALKASADATTGEVSIAKPLNPTRKVFRVLSLAVDQGDAGEIYIARYLPRGTVTGFAEQSFGGGDDAIGWGVTFTGEQDSVAGYSERWIFGGPGWFALLAKMGFGA